MTARPAVRLRWVTLRRGSETTNGHFYIRWLQDQGIWKFSFFEKGASDYVTSEGTNPLEGGAVFLDLTQQTFNAYLRYEQEQVDVARLCLGGKSKNYKMIQPGFRPLTAEQYWKNLTGQVLRNYSHTTAAAIAQALGKLRTGRWIEDTSVFKSGELNLVSPWDKA